ncbi:hypothetical protein [Sorangium sp. So ce176]|uniref:hypothetical protein n=1 Tax=Sorangium sp. So ce176 TaxID=3133286 RepID=UPI003F5D9090
MKKISTATLLLAALAIAGASTAACQGEKAPLAPAATELEAPEAKAPAAATFAIDKAGSKVELMMDAPKEKTRGRIEGSAEGTLQVDPSDITRTTGLITVDLSPLELLQTEVLSPKVAREAMVSLEFTAGATAPASAAAPADE